MQPSRTFLNFTVHPANLRAAMAEVKQHRYFDTIRDDILEANSSLCEVTGLPADDVVPRWQFCSHTQEVSLVELQPMCEQLVRLLQYEHCTKRERRAMRPLMLEALEDYNNWQAHEAEMYLRKEEGLVHERQKESWSVDVSLLDDLFEAGWGRSDSEDQQLRVV